VSLGALAVINLLDITILGGFHMIVSGNQLPKVGEQSIYNNKNSPTNNKNIFYTRY